MINTKNEMFKPTNKMENLLIAMPKKCSCHLCETTKGMAKSTLGEKKYKEICNVIGIVA